MWDDMILELDMLIDEKKNLDFRIIECIIDTFPKGSTFVFMKNDKPINCTICDHSGERLLIQNNKTSKRYWIDSWWLINDKTRRIKC